VEINRIDTAAEGLPARHTHDHSHSHDHHHLHDHDEELIMSIHMIMRRTVRM
jgi:hypothetical protein